MLALFIPLVIAIYGWVLIELMTAPLDPAETESSDLFVDATGEIFIMPKTAA